MKKKNLVQDAILSSSLHALLFINWDSEQKKQLVCCGKKQEMLSCHFGTALLLILSSISIRNILLVQWGEITFVSDALILDSQIIKY